MSFNLIEIFKAWAAAANPTEVQKKLADERINICMKCEFRKEIFHNKNWSATCGKCGCPLSKKIFTDQYGTCPLSKWNAIEEKYLNHLKVKKNSII